MLGFEERDEKRSPKREHEGTRSRESGGDEVWSAFRGKVKVTCIIFSSTFSSAGTGAESPGRRLDPGFSFARQMGE